MNERITKRDRNIKLIFNLEEPKTTETSKSISVLSRKILGLCCARTYFTNSGNLLLVWKPTTFKEHAIMTYMLPLRELLQNLL